VERLNVAMALLDKWTALNLSINHLQLNLQTGLLTAKKKKKE
jgi:hypothetical protein